MLAALTDRAIVDVEGIFLDADGGLGDRLTRYLGWIPGHQWAHRLWLVSEAGAGDSEFRAARRRLVEASVGTPNEDQDHALRMRAKAWVAAVESTVTNWLEQGQPDRDQVVEALLDLAVRLDVAGAKPAARAWRKRKATPSR